MGNSFSEFLSSLAELDLSRSYGLLFRDFSDERERVIADQLKAIITSHFVRDRGKKFGALLRLRAAGFLPQVVVDVGAQIGTPELYWAFPDAHHVFVEPVEECLPKLREIALSLKSAEVLHCAASHSVGRTTLNLSVNGQYSSISEEMGGETREVKTTTVDEILRTFGFSTPALVKIDVDGAEFAVLKGAERTLDSDVIFVIEASIAESKPRFQSLIEIMGAHGYRVYDIVDPLYRPSDWHLWQVDLVFAKSTSSVWGSFTFT
jgi:FkbM family methyltransferase